MANKYPQSKKCPYCGKRLFYSTLSGGYICFGGCRLKGEQLKPDKSKTKKTP